jgi:hypothetical protein
LEFFAEDSSLQDLNTFRSLLQTDQGEKNFHKFKSDLPRINFKGKKVDATFDPISSDYVQVLNFGNLKPLILISNLLTLLTTNSQWLYLVKLFVSIPLLTKYYLGLPGLILGTCSCLIGACFMICRGCLDRCCGGKSFCSF